MPTDDLVVASTTDTEEAMQAALLHGIEAPSGAPVLSIEDADEPEAPPKAEKEAPKAAEAPPAKKAETKPAEPEKKPEAKADTKPEAKTGRPRREDYESEDDWGDALMGHRAKKRIDTLTYEREEARRKADALEARVTELEKKPAADGDKSAAPATEPKADDYETNEEWIAALVAHKTALGVEAALEKERAKVDKADEGIQREEEFQKFLGQRTEARERYDDFDEVIKDNKDMDLNGIMNYVIMSSDVGNDIAYYLATHRDEAAALYALDGPDAIRAMGKLEHKVEHIVASKVGKAKAEQVADDEATAGGEKKADEKPAPKPKAASQAAAPIEPIGSRSARSTVPDDELPYTDFKAKRDREELNRRKYRR